MAGFVLHPVLAADTHPVSSLPVSELRLMNDSRFPWCILVPRLADLVEWHDLPQDARLPLMEEIERVSRLLLTLPRVQKINVGALGNQVPQLHIHVIGRHPEDPAWPGPVWGFGVAEPYPAATAARLIDSLTAGLAASA